MMVPKQEREEIWSVNPETQMNDGDLPTLLLFIQYKLCN